MNILEILGVLVIIVSSLFPLYLIFYVVRTLALSIDLYLWRKSLRHAHRRNRVTEIWSNVSLVWDYQHTNTNITYWRHGRCYKYVPFWLRYKGKNFK